jgi:pyruvate dehydrogenase E1 component alpha subunit
MAKQNYSKEFLANLYQTLYTIRVFESECIQLYRQALIRGYFHPYLGEEAIAVGVCAALREQDYITSTHRGHGHCIARGGNLNLMMAELFGKENGYCAGRGGSMHIADISAGNLGANGIVGAGIPLGVGAALGASIRGEDRVAVVFTSDGGANNGVFAEALNLAAIWNLPMILVIENNQYAVSTPIEAVSRDSDLYKRGKGYGVDSFAVDGNDVLKVYEHTQKSIRRCQKGKGPILMEAKTYRFGGHHCNDPGKYMPQERMDHYKSKDPVLIGRNYLREIGGASESEIGLLENDVQIEIKQAIAFSKNSPEPSVENFIREVQVLR